MKAAPGHPFTSIRKIKGVCEECGRVTIWGRDRIGREQVRRRFESVEQLGSRLLCEFCVSTGRAGRNVSIEVRYDEPPRPPAFADQRPLSEIASIISTCSDCGDQKLFDREKLDAFSAAAPNVYELWRKAFCGTCRADGSTRASILFEVQPPLARPGDRPKNVEWSKAVVFGENRSDPFPGLPRSRFAAS